MNWDDYRAEAPDLLRIEAAMRGDYPAEPLRHIEALLASAPPEDPWGDDPQPAAAWGDPVPFITPAPPAGLPPTITGTLLGDVATMFHEQWGVPELLPLDVLAGVAMAATNGNYTVAKSPATKFPLAAYLMVLASPGSLKSPVLAVAAEPLKQAQAEESDRKSGPLAAGRAKHQALLAAIKKRTDDLGKAIGNRNREAEAEAEADIEALGGQVREAEALCAGVETLTLGADLTYEALIAKAAANGGRAALLSAEGGLIENLLGRYSDGQARTEFLNSAHDGERYSGERVGDGARIIGEPWACLVQVVQPAVAATLLGNGHATGRGFAQRFWYAAVPDTRYRNRLDLPDLDTATLTAWGSAVRAIRCGNGRTLTIAPPARALLLDYENDHVAPLAGRHGDNGPLSGWLGKCAMTGLRWAAVLQLLADPDSSVITAAQMRAAVGFLDLHVRHAVWMFGQSPAAAGKSPRARVLEWLADLPRHTDNTDTTSRGGPKQGPEEGSVGSVGMSGSVATREAHRRFQDQKWCSEAEDVRAVLADLAALGWLDGPEQATGDNGGRPSERWRLHPDIARHYKQMMTGP